MWGSTFPRPVGWTSISLTVPEPRHPVVYQKQMQKRLLRLERHSMLPGIWGILIKVGLDFAKFIFTLSYNFPVCFVGGFKIELLDAKDELIQTLTPEDGGSKKDGWIDQVSILLLPLNCWFNENKVDGYFLCGEKYLTLQSNLPP